MAEARWKNGLASDAVTLSCSVCVADKLAAQARLDEAMELYESLCGRAGSLRLLSDEMDPSTGAFLGNHPQAFSHVGVVSSGMNLARQLRRLA